MTVSTPTTSQKVPSVQAFPIRFVDLNVTDLARSVDFYTRHLELPVIDTPHLDDDEAWLDGGPTVLRLHRRPDGTASSWTADDRQLGFRHLGFAVTGLDERVEHLHEAGVLFHLEPLDATGDVRITFFYDPDGVLLEFIQGRLNHHKVWNPSLVADVHARPVPARPTFDHVAVTARDQAATIDFYRSTLGFDVSGQLFHRDDPRGFEITYLHAGDTVLELFTFAAENSPSPWSADDTTIGFRYVGFGTDELSDATRADLLDRLGRSGAVPVDDPACGLVLDHDGFPLKTGSR